MRVDKAVEYVHRCISHYGLLSTAGVVVGPDRVRPAEKIGVGERAERYSLAPEFERARSGVTARDARRPPRGRPSQDRLRSYEWRTTAEFQTLPLRSQLAPSVVW